MKLKEAPIQCKLMKVILMTCGAVLVLTCACFFAYEFFTFRQTLRAQLATQGEIIATNSTAALGFLDEEAAAETLRALRAEKHVIAACLYDQEGKIFSVYPTGFPVANLPPRPGADGYRFEGLFLEGFQPVVQETRLGTLYLKSDMKAMYQRIELYVVIAFLVIGISFLLAYFLSRRLQKTISEPILALAETARVVSERHDYSVRATRSGVDELGLLTDAFNHMLTQIENQNQEITTFNQKLEEKVRERTAQLENAKNEIEVMNRKLVKSNQDLEQFAYVASHDLQEPLRKIQTFSELAERSTGDKETLHKYLEKINVSARRMADLIRSVLNYSRLSRLNEEFSVIDLNATMDSIRSDLELLIAEKKAEIRCDPLPVIRGIPLQLNQLFLNLISNSLKFSEKKPVIDISSKILPGSQIRLNPDLNSAGNYVELKFTDNGIGFEQQYADKIFTIFQRLHTSQHYAGTGIGLALCKKIVENHHGFIIARSEPGKGAEFYVYLPVEG